MKKLIKSIKAVFEDFDESDFNENMALAEIPDWDSMNSVNFQMELESAFGVQLKDNFLNAALRMADVAKELKRLGADITINTDR